MTLLRLGRAATAATLAVSFFGFNAYAAGKDYRFELVGAKPADNGHTDVGVRLVHISDSKSVTDAKITQTKMDMGPSGMGTMLGKVMPQDVGKDGLYHFLVMGGMAGKWQLTLDATVKGESEPVHGSVIFESK